MGGSGKGVRNGNLWPKAEDRTRNAAAAMMAETLSSADRVRTDAGE